MIPKEELSKMYCDEKMSMAKIGDLIGISSTTVCKYMKSYKIKSRTLSEAKPYNLTNISKEKLQEMYLDNCMTQMEIGDLLGVSNTVIVKLLISHNIELRTRSESRLGDLAKPSKKELQRMYHDEKMTFTKVANVVGVSVKSIQNWMNEYGIKSRTRSESMLGNSIKPSKERLQEMYLDKKMSAYEIAEVIGVTQKTIHDWMKEFGIESRTVSESLIGRTGEKSGGWRGGISGGKYCYKFNSIFKEAVRKRDNYTCQLCRCKQNGEKLSVHHIHYDKANCWPDVVTLCRSCNGKVNGNRDYWEKYFEDDLIARRLFCWSLSQEN